jgi:hypothetical protein
VLGSLAPKVPRRSLGAFAHGFRPSQHDGGGHAGAPNEACRSVAACVACLPPETWRVPLTRVWLLAAAIALSQRQDGLKSLFRSIGALDPLNTTMHGISVRKGVGAAPGGGGAGGEPGGKAQIAKLSAFLRSVRVVGDKPMELQGWVLRPLSEVALLELLMRAAWSRHEETAVRQSYHELTSVDYDQLSYQQFEMVLVQIAMQTMSSPKELEGTSFFDVSGKAAALLDYLEVPYDGMLLSVPASRAQSPSRTFRPGSHAGTPATATRQSEVGRHFGDSDAQWMRPGTQSSMRPGSQPGSQRSSGGPGSPSSRSMQKSFSVSRPSTRNSDRPGTAESSNTREYWQKVLALPLRSQSRVSDSLVASMSVSRPQTTDPLVKRVKQTGYGTKGIAKQWLREAIRIINPNDSSWRLTKETIELFLVKVMKVTPESCDVLKPGMLNEMFAETDLDKDGTVSIEELALAVSARFKRRLHAERWKTVVRMANQVSLQRKHWPPEVYLNPPIESGVFQPKSREPIRTQYENANNYPDHCGYGPIEYGEGHKTEKLNAGALLSDEKG